MTAYGFMHDPITEPRPTLTRFTASLVLCMALVGCSSTGEYGVALFADPGKYQYHNCQQLAEAAKATQTRHQELQQLIEKANQGLAGPVISAAVYRTEHRSTGEELVLIARTQRTKNCLTSSNWRSNAAVR
ncbi:MAG: hypothetical protein ACRECO_10910 [Xanthobacteraceae bacterium]